MAKPDIQPHDSVDTLRTGDLLLFSGRGFTSDVIRVFTRSPWSHIGMVLHLPGQPEPLVLESNKPSPSISMSENSLASEIVAASETDKYSSSSKQ